MLMWKGHMGIYLEGITWAWLIIKWLILTSFVIWAPVLLYEPQCLLWLEWGLIQQCQAGSQCCWYPCGWASSLSCCREKWIAASLRAAGKGETHGMQWLKEMPNISWKSAWFLMYILNQSYTRWAECCSLIVCMRAPLTAQLVKNPPPMQETPVQFLGQEDLLEKG